jgi:hypothetical protein
MVIIPPAFPFAATGSFYVSEPAIKRILSLRLASWLSGNINVKDVSQAVVIELIGHIVLPVAVVVASPMPGNFGRDLWGVFSCEEKCFT